jgi:hypothetical protein
MDPRAFSLAASANVEASSRIRGPQYWDLRAGVRPREDVDLSAHLIEAPRSARKSNAGTQSDALRPAPREATFDDLRCKSGVDAASQVPHGFRTRGSNMSGATDALFNFDTEVAPRVSLLCRDVIAQAIEELSHEGDLQALQVRRKLTQSALDADAAKATALTAAALAHGVSREATVNAARAAYARQLSAIERVSAVGMAGGAVKGTIDAAFKRARAEGWLVDADRAAVENVLMPSAILDVGKRVAAVGAGGFAASLIDGAVAAALRHREAKPARFAIKVYVRLPAAVANDDWRNSTDTVEVIEERGYRTVVVGPIRISKEETVGDVETRIGEWLENYKTSKAVARVLTLSGGFSLGLHLAGMRLGRHVPLLSTPLDKLGGLELRPMQSADESVDWLLEIPLEEAITTSATDTADTVQQPPVEESLASSTATTTDTADTVQQPPVEESLASSAATATDTVLQLVESIAALPPVDSLAETEIIPTPTIIDDAAVIDTTTITTTAVTAVTDNDDATVAALTDTKEAVIEGDATSILPIESPPPAATDGVLEVAHDEMNHEAAEVSPDISLSETTTLNVEEGEK